MPLLIPGSDASDEELLSSGNPQRRIALVMGVPLEPSNQRILDRAIDNDWVRFVDMTPAMVSGMNGTTMVRVFRITDAGLARLNEIRKRKVIDAVR